MAIPSCQNIYLVDNENVLAIQDGSGNVYICSIESQKKAFLEREYMMKPQVEEIKTIKLEDSEPEAAWYGLRNRNKLKRSDSTEFDIEENPDSTGVKVIVSKKAFRKRKPYS